MTAVLQISTYNKMIKGIFGGGKSSSKNPAEIVRLIKEDLLILEKAASVSHPNSSSVVPSNGSSNNSNGDTKKEDKAREDLSKQLINMKTLLFGPDPSNSSTSGGGSGSSVGGSGGNNLSDQQSDIVLAQLSQEVYTSNLLLLLLTNLHRIDFEGKKDVVQIFSNILRRQIGTRTPTVEYICTKPEIITTLCAGYDQQSIALNCGTMLRECVRFESLAKMLLHSQHFYNFFNYVQVSTFDIASDAFATFKELLTRHKMLAATFLEANFEDVFVNRYQKLLHSENYVTRRQSLKLLGELLLDRHNFSVMTRYISSGDNLKLIMNMLKEKSRNIQFEAFHVFKVFVANPNKPEPILAILIRNKDKLIEFLQKFQSDRSDDEQFNDEKAYLIKQIRELKPIAANVKHQHGSTTASNNNVVSTAEKEKKGGAEEKK